MPARRRDPGPVFSALADPTRREVMRALAERGPATATELATQFPISRQAVAKHLGLLTEAGLVTAVRQGRELRYTLDPAPLSDAMGWMATVGDEWDTRLTALDAHLRAGR